MIITKISVKINIPIKYPNNLAKFQKKILFKNKEDPSTEKRVNASKPNICPLKEDASSKQKKISVMEVFNLFPVTPNYKEKQTNKQSSKYRLRRSAVQQIYSSEENDFRNVSRCGSTYQHQSKPLLQRNKSKSKLRG